MSANIESRQRLFDHFKWVVVVLLVAGGIVGNSYYSEEPALYRWIALTVLAIVATLMALQTTRGREIWELIGASRTEIRKVVWPTRVETTQTTLLVVAVVIVMGIFLWLLDILLNNVVLWVIG